MTCIYQVKILFNGACNFDRTSIGVIGAFILDVIDSLSGMLSVTPRCEGTTLNPLPLLWMSRLTHVIYECFDFASQLSIELSKPSNDSPEDPLPWLPSPLDVFLLVVCSMCSKTSLAERSVMLPALRLLSNLLETGNLESPPDPDVEPDSTLNPKVYWFSSSEQGNDERGFELLSKLVELEESYIERDQTYIPYFAARFLSKSKPSFKMCIFSVLEIPPVKHLRCPLLLLCRLLYIEQHTLSSGNVVQHCRLLAEVSF